MKNLKNSIWVAAVMSFASFAVANAGETASNPNFVTLNSTPSAELPAKAADLVLQSAPKQRAETTVNVVKTAVPLNPASAPVVVGAIAKAAPDMAALAASTAASLIPDRAAAFARAAAAAAPDKAGQIVEAVCRVCPKSYQKIAQAVAEVAPNANKEILSGIALAIPQLKSSIDQIVAQHNGTVPSVSAVINDPIVSVASADIPVPVSQLPGMTVQISPPSFGPPYVPPPPTHNPIDPGSGGQVPTGSRPYASP